MAGHAQRQAADAAERRRFIEIRPVLDYAALTPGKAATDAIRQAAADLKLDTAIWREAAAHRTCADLG